jgi:hypothetical protein
MWQKKMVVGCLMAILLGAFSAGTALAQERERGGERPNRRTRRRFDPEQMRRRMMERYRDRLGASEEEWTVLGPRLQEVMELSSQTRGGMFRRRFGGRRGAPEREQTEANLNPVRKASRELQKVVEAEQPDAAVIKEKLTALRQAREGVKAKLEQAQERLREVITVKQEAQLVLMDVLD